MKTTALKLSGLIANEWLALENACERIGPEANVYLDRAYTAALYNEKKHRDSDARFSSPTASVKHHVSAPTAARFYVLKWFSSKRTKVACGEKINYLEAARTPPESFYAYALRQLLSERAPETLKALLGTIGSPQYNVKTLEMSEE